MRGCLWGYMTAGAAEVVTLPKLKRQAEGSENGGSVVPFDWG